MSNFRHSRKKRSTLGSKADRAGVPALEGDQWVAAELRRRAEYLQSLRQTNAEWPVVELRPKREGFPSLKIFKNPHGGWEAILPGTKALIHFGGK